MAATNLFIESPPSVVWRVREAWGAVGRFARGIAACAAVISVVIAVGSTTSVGAQLGVAATGVVFVAASVVDVHEHKLPNRLLVIAAVVTVAAALSSNALAEAAIGAAYAGGAMLLVRLSRGVGMGDVKMAAVIGASSGSLAPVAAPCALAITAVVAATYGAVTRRPSLALGPALWLGWAIGVACATPLARWWS